MSEVKEAIDKRDQKVTNEGYSAFIDKKDLVKDNPYPSDLNNHWLWRKGYLEAFQEANPPAW